MPELNFINMDFVGKHFNRKDSADSGISVDRKSSTNSNVSIGSIMEEPGEDTIKEEIVYVEPDLDLCEKITQQVKIQFKKYTLIDLIENVKLSRNL